MNFAKNVSCMKKSIKTNNEITNLPTNETTNLLVKKMQKKSLTIIQIADKLIKQKNEAIANNLRETMDHQKFLSKIMPKIKEFKKKFFIKKNAILKEIIQTHETLKKIKISVKKDFEAANVEIEKLNLIIKELRKENRILKEKLLNQENQKKN